MSLILPTGTTSLTQVAEFPFACFACLMSGMSPFQPWPQSCDRILSRAGVKVHVCWKLFQNRRRTWTWRVENFHMEQNYNSEMRSGWNVKYRLQLQRPVEGSVTADREKWPRLSQHLILDKHLLFSANTATSNPSKPWRKHFFYAREIKRCRISAGHCFPAAGREGFSFMWNHTELHWWIHSVIWCFSVIIAKDFIIHLMEKDPSSRYTCEQALQHPWYRCFTPRLTFQFPCFSVFAHLSVCQDRRRHGSG